MTFDERVQTVKKTILRAAGLFGVLENCITAGGIRRTPEVVKAREFVVGCWPQESLGVLSKALNLDRASVILIRRRIAQKKSTGELTTQHSTNQPYYVQ